MTFRCGIPMGAVIRIANLATSIKPDPHWPACRSRMILDNRIFFLGGHWWKRF
jgi:hypothetical protein